MSPTFDQTPSCQQNHSIQCHAQSPLEHLQGRWLHHFPGQSVPILNQHFSEEILSDVQPEPPLLLLEVISLVLLDNIHISFLATFVLTLQGEKAKGKVCIVIYTDFFFLLCVLQYRCSYRLQNFLSFRRNCFLTFCSIFRLTVLVSTLVQEKFKPFVSAWAGILVCLPEEGSWLYSRVAEKFCDPKQETMKMQSKVMYCILLYREFFLPCNNHPNPNDVTSLKYWKYGTIGEYFYACMILFCKCLILRVIFCHPVLLFSIIFSHLIICWGWRVQFVCMSPCCFSQVARLK